jgi:hypothetical protein
MPVRIKQVLKLKSTTAYMNRRQATVLPNGGAVDQNYCVPLDDVTPILRRIQERRTAHTASDASAQSK